MEVYNDLDNEVVNLFRVLRDHRSRKQLEEKLYLTPFARDEFFQAYEETECPVEKARRMIIRAQMGFGSAGATKGKTGFRMAGGRQKNYELVLWDKYPDRLQGIASRLKQVLIENQEASKIINYFDNEDTLFFVDPPYVRSTRAANVTAYRYEMSDLDHIALLDQLNEVRGRVIISGYEHEIYNTRLSHWKKVSKLVQASGNRGGVTREEVLWINPQAKNSQPDLFGEIA